MTDCASSSPKPIDPVSPSGRNAPGGVRATGVRGLVLANVVLGGILVALWGTGTGALAQPGAAGPGQPRPRGQYLVVSGRLNGMPANAIYLLDTANQEMVALRWERSRNDLIGLGYRSVSDDGKAAGGGR